MRSLMYVAGVVAAIAIGMYQGPRETGTAVGREVGSGWWNCDNSGIDTGADCPGPSCSDTYDAEKTAKPWTEKQSVLTSDCTATGCTFSWSVKNRTDDCNTVN